MSAACPQAGSLEESWVSAFPLPSREGSPMPQALAHALQELPTLSPSLPPNLFFLQQSRARPRCEDSPRRCHCACCSGPPSGDGSPPNYRCPPPPPPARRETSHPCGQRQGMSGSRQAAGSMARPGSHQLRVEARDRLAPVPQRTAIPHVVLRAQVDHRLGIVCTGDGEARGSSMVQD